MMDYICKTPLYNIWVISGQYVYNILSVYGQYLNNIWPMYKPKYNFFLMYLYYIWVILENICIITVPYVGVICTMFVHYLGIIWNICLQYKLCLDNMCTIFWTIFWKI